MDRRTQIVPYSGREVNSQLKKISIGPIFPKKGASVPEIRFFTRARDDD
jgi:hypothetical protein